MYAMPIGVDSFRKIIEGKYYWIDKTLFIKDLLDNKNEVILITCSRIFGKALAMRMLQEFFDINLIEENLFAGFSIINVGEKYIYSLGANILLYFFPLRILLLEVIRRPCVICVARFHSEYSFLVDFTALNE